MSPELNDPLTGDERPRVDGGRGGPGPQQGQRHRTPDRPAALAQPHAPGQQVGNAQMRLIGFDLNHKINPLFKQSSRQMALSL